MPRFQRRQRFAAFLGSRAFTILLLLLAAGMSLAVGREIARRVSVQREIDRLTKHIGEAERSSTELQNLIASLKSSTFEEGVARTRFNLQKSGESVLVIPNLTATPSANAAPESPEQTNVPAETKNTQRWWNYFFAHKSS